MTPNKTLIFKKIPTGLPIPGEHLVIENRPIDLSTPPPSGLLVEVLSVSLDPYLRGRMRLPSIPSYKPAFPLNTPVANDALARVLKSDTPKFQEGDVLYIFLPVAEYVAVTPEMLHSAVKLENKYSLPLDVFLGPLGMPGLTAFSSLHQIGKPRRGETIFVSSAAGAVGSLVGQLAKREGMTVIGSVGSDEKLDFILKELGFDAGFNYKKERPWDALGRLAPGGIDVYYENVGGAHLEAALEHLRVRGRVVVCGMIEGYNSPLEERYGVRNLLEIFAKRLSVAGFLVSDEDFGPKYTRRHQECVQKWIAEGSVKAKLHVTRGIENAAEGLVEIFQGKNFGKAVLKIKE
ncbi:NAD(P)-binding protein [Annulohypoxylon maeteangense]|uniref:NAD(P)-binding protein n=1 Tax=Annulohypoxylon maeteangense TaxID=1927788 RepID=UPI002007AE5C|nr:NAD(P)-binding protein [Annulohypoxylon maeteangense]KAI0888811.1 NAD(P)-binding protein [Annulohypoxylon maeteangense]